MRKMDYISIFENSGFFFKCSDLRSGIFLSKELFDNSDTCIFCKGLLEAGNDFIFEKIISDRIQYWDCSKDRFKVKNQNNFIFGIKLNPEEKIKAQFLLQYKKIKKDFPEDILECPINEVRNYYFEIFSSILRYEIPKEEFSSELLKIYNASRNINFAHAHFSFKPKNKTILIENILLGYDLYKLKHAEKSLRRNDEKQKRFFLQGNEIMPVLEKIQKLEFSNIE